MEILSDATFKGNVSINGGDFSITRLGESEPLIQTNKQKDGDNYALYVNGSEFVKDNIIIGGRANIEGGAMIYGGIFLQGDVINRWSDLNHNIIRIFTSPLIPANCTAFEFNFRSGSAISDTNLENHLIQVKNTSTGKSVIAETWMTTNKKPAMTFAGCTSTIAAGTYMAVVV